MRHSNIILKTILLFFCNCVLQRLPHTRNRQNQDTRHVMPSACTEPAFPKRLLFALNNPDPVACCSRTGAQHIMDWGATLAA